MLREKKKKKSLIGIIIFSSSRGPATPAGGVAVNQKKAVFVIHKALILILLRPLLYSKELLNLS